MIDGEIIQGNVEDAEEVTGQIETRTRIFVDSAGVDDTPVIDKVERTGLGVGGMTETVDIRITTAGCRHLLHMGSEAGGVCANPQCRRILCKDCSKQESMCSGCGMLVCGSCQRRIWLQANDTVLCPLCARKWWHREMTIAAVVCLIAYILLGVFI